MRDRNSIPFLNGEQLKHLSEQLFNTNARSIKDDFKRADYESLTKAFQYICKNAQVQLSPFVSGGFRPHNPYETAHKNAIKYLERTTHSFINEQANSLDVLHQRKLIPYHINTHASVILPHGRELNKFRVALLVETKNNQDENIIPVDGDWIRYKDGAVWKILISAHHLESHPKRIVLFSHPAFIEDCSRIPMCSSDLYELPAPSFLLKRGLKKIQELVNKKSNYCEKVDESSVLEVKTINTSENRHSFQLNTVFGDFWLVATWCELSLRTSVTCREVQGRTAQMPKK